MGKVSFAAGANTREGYLARPDGGTGPGVLVLHAWWGLTPVFTNFCDRLAADGFTAFAPDLHHSKVATTIEEAEELMAARDFDATMETALAALDYLKEHTGPSPCGAVGFSMGASYALLLSEQRPDAFAATVFFYGAAGAELADAPGVYLGHYGETDTWDPVEEVRKMTAANLTVHVYPGVGHWFFESDRPDHYVPDAAELAYKRTVEFLRANLPLV